MPRHCDLDVGGIRSRIQTGQSRNPDGLKGYVSNGEKNSLTVIRLARRSDRPIGTRPHYSLCRLPGNPGLWVGGLGLMRSGPVRLAGLVLSAVGVLAGCGTTSAPTAPATPAAPAAAESPPPAAATRSPSPAAVRKGPSVSARMVCAAEAQEEITQALGLALRRRATSVWAAPVYRCTYPLTAGPLVLSVRELADARDTTAYFAAARAAAEGSTDLPGLGEAAFATADGSVYVRKDFKVLKVDVNKLPTAVGKARISRADAAYLVAQLIMGCWTGT